jgi:biopolymer transport protein ExbB
MIGLLGTVSGMIKAFQTIAAGGMGKPELLAGNIGEALITTAAGLIIAIPAMISYFIFKNDFIKNMSTMGRLVSHFMSVYRNARQK